MSSITFTGYGGNEISNSQHPLGVLVDGEWATDIVLDTSSSTSVKFTSNTVLNGSQDYNLDENGAYATSKTIWSNQPQPDSRLGEFNSAMGRSPSNDNDDRFMFFGRDNFSSTTKFHPINQNSASVWCHELPSYPEYLWRIQRKDDWLSYNYPLPTIRATSDTLPLQYMIDQSSFSSNETYNWRENLDYTWDGIKTYTSQKTGEQKNFLYKYHPWSTYKAWEIYYGSGHIGMYPNSASNQWGLYNQKYLITPPLIDVTYSGMQSVIAGFGYTEWGYNNTISSFSLANQSGSYTGLVFFIRIPKKAITWEYGDQSSGTDGGYHAARGLGDIPMNVTGPVENAGATKTDGLSVQATDWYNYSSQWDEYFWLTKKIDLTGTGQVRVEINDRGTEKSLWGGATGSRNWYCQINN
jgi:hypothetical protein